MLSPPGSPEVGTHIRALLTPPIDLNHLRARASYNRLLPLLYGTSVEYEIRLVPEPELGELATAFRANAARNLRLTSELIALTKAFASAEIPVLPHNC